LGKKPPTATSRPNPRPTPHQEKEVALNDNGRSHRDDERSKKNEQGQAARTIASRAKAVLDNHGEDKLKALRLASRSRRTAAAGRVEKDAAPKTKKADEKSRNWRIGWQVSKNGGRALKNAYDAGAGHSIIEGVLVAASK